MKLAKQIILLSATGLCAIGLSLVLITGIVIGNEVSSTYKTEMRGINVTYDRAVHNIDARYEGGFTYTVDGTGKVTATAVPKGLIEQKTDEIANKPRSSAPESPATTVEDQVATLEGYVTSSTGAKTKGTIETAEDNLKTETDNLVGKTPDTTPTLATQQETVAAAQRLVDFRKAELQRLKDENAAAVERLGEEQKEELAVAKVERNTARIAAKEAKKNRIPQSFWYPDTTDTLVATEIGGVPVVRDVSNTTRTITPMGKVMIAGIAFTLMGAALVITVIIMNKCASEPAPKASAKK